MICPHCGTETTIPGLCANCCNPVQSLGSPDDPTVVTPLPGAQASAGTGPLAVGQAFGARYHVIKVLGVGGMGAVYQVWDAELAQGVALKVIRPEAAGDPLAAREMERRFKQELVLARQVSHPNVVRNHDLGSDGDSIFITMDFVDGLSLGELRGLAGRLGEEREDPLSETWHGLRAAHSSLGAGR